MTDMQSSVARRIQHPWRVAALVVALVVVALVIALASVLPFSSETARRKVIEVLSARLDAEVELSELRFRVLPQFHAEGVGLTIRHRGRRDVPPLISIKQFSAEGNVFSLLRRHITRLTVDELDIEIPPDRNRDPLSDRDSPASEPPEGDSADIARAFVIDELLAKDARFVIIPRDTDKLPKVWSIHDLRMQSVSLDRPMPFTASLENAVPPGAIETSGSFGPWGREEPGQTPLEGKFTFERADLGVFKGISGILAAKGTFEGTLERIEVHGVTDTPDFTVEAGGHPMPLHATYHAIVDGTNGDTLLEKVDASFLKTSLTARGGVVKRPGKDGRTVELDVVIDDGRLEDVLLMAVKTPTPPMSGALKLTTRFELPPGDRDVVEKLQLDGVFTIANARFASPRRAEQDQRIEPENAGAGRIASREGRLAICREVHPPRGRARAAACHVRRTWVGDSSQRTIRARLGTDRLRRHDIHRRGHFGNDDRLQEPAVETRRPRLQARRGRQRHSDQNHRDATGAGIRTR